MTKEELLQGEDKIYEAIRKAYGYGEVADKLIDIVWEAIDLLKDKLE